MKMILSSFLLVVLFLAKIPHAFRHEGGYNTCANIRCEPGQVCEMTQVQCFRAPCPRVPTCVPRPQRSCANVHCQPGYSCEMRSGRPECVRDPPPPLTCANILCRQGYVCEMRNGQPQCVRGGSNTCANVRCESGQTCQMINGFPQCVNDRPSSTCANIFCGRGTHCEIRNGRPQCVPVGGGGGQCSWDWVCRRRSTWESCNSQRCCRWSRGRCEARSGSHCASRAPCGGGGGGGGQLICPLPPSDFFGICVERCFSGSCPRGQLCCSNGCGHECMAGVPS